MQVVFFVNNEMYAESPEFNAPEGNEAFFDQLGGEDEDSELFWNAEIMGSDNSIDVFWLDGKPSSEQKIIESISLMLGATVPNFDTWKVVS